MARYRRARAILLAAAVGVWVNMGDDQGQSFFMDPAGTIVEEAAAGGDNQILYRDYSTMP